MVHKFTETMTDVGEGIGGLTRGMYPLATLPILFGTAEMTTGVMKGVSKKVSGKTKKKIKRKSKRRRKKK